MSGARSPEGPTPNMSYCKNFASRTRLSDLLTLWIDGRVTLLHQIRLFPIFPSGSPPPNPTQLLETA